MAHRSGHVIQLQRLNAIALVLFAILTSVLPAAAAPVKARSLSGSGVLLLRSKNGLLPAPIVLYREPGMGRIVELDATQLPQILPSCQAPDGERAVIVTAKKLDWYRIVYDDGEREGWLQWRAEYRYQRWEELLPEGEVVVPAGLRKDYYLLRSEPDPAGEPLAAISRNSGLTVLRIAGDWVDVRRDAEVSGWLRWRDDNGRLLISMDCRILLP